MNPAFNNIDEVSAEKASNVYLMSVVGIMTGLPLPILNLLATVVFYLGNKKASKFVRWHCIQGIFSQLLLFSFNSFSFWWTISILFYKEELSNAYFSYVFFVLFINLIEIISTIYTAIKVRKGEHIQWFFYGPLVNLIFKIRK